jgi:putative oxidoreductase
MDFYDADGLNLGLFALRVVVGLTLAAHGLAKVQSGLENVGRWFDSEGLRPGRMHATIAATVETAGGALLALGLLTPLAGAALVGNMTVAAYIGHRKNGFFIIRNGWEFTFVLATVAAVLAATGPGQWSLDNAIGLEWRGVAWFIVVAVGGVAAAVAFLAAFYRPVPAPTEAEA